MQRLTLGLVPGVALVAVALFVAASSAWTSNAVAPVPGAPEAHWRHPVALALLPGGQHLVSANRANGSLSLVDLKTGKSEETDLAQSLVDVVAAADGTVLAIDAAMNRLFRLRYAEGRLTLVDALEVPLGPAGVRLAPDGRTGYVTCRWARRVVAIDLGATLKLRWSTHLGFAPRALEVTPDGKQVIVGDAYAGKVAVVESGSGTFTGVRELPGHNLGGFTWSPDRQQLLVAYSVMDPETETSMYNVHWGNVVVHRLRQLDLRTLLNPKTELVQGSKQINLDGLTNGATDPGASAFDPRGRLLLCIGGLDSLMVNALTDGQRQRIRVGRRPASVVVAGTRAYVANTFDDTLSVFDLANDQTLPALRLGPTPPLTDAVRGQQLFHDARLSHNGWMSCHTCHGDGHTNGKRADTFADGSHGTPKRTLSLLGVAETGPWNWNGQTEKLDELVDRSLRTTMYPDDILRDDVRALAAYLRTLQAAPPEPVANVAAVERGQAVFAEQNCARCHAPPLYTSKKVADVGLVDEKGKREFNPPSLRGLRLAGPFFHDSRARTLEDVFRVHKHQLKGELTPEQLRDLLAFLESL